MRSYLPTEKIPVKSFTIARRWDGDSFWEEHPDIPHIKRECRHTKLDASFEVRPFLGRAPEEFVPAQLDDSHFSIERSDGLYPKDHHWILTGSGKPPITSVTSYGEPAKPGLLSSDFVTIWHLDRDRYSSASPWRYRQVVKGLYTRPVFLRESAGEYFVAYVTLSYSFGTRWESGYDENWSSDESLYIKCYNSRWNWDALRGEWTNRTPYNRIFRSNLSTDYVKRFLSDPHIVDQFKLPVGPVAMPTAAIADRTWHFPDIDKRLFLESYCSNLIGTVNSIVARCTHVPFPVSTHQKDLHLEIVKGLHTFDSNLPLYFEDLPKVGGTITTVMEALNTRDLKSVSATWLSARFADRLTFADTKELRDAVESACIRGTLLLNRKIKRYARDTVNSTISYNGFQYSLRERWNSHAFFKPKGTPETQAYYDLIRLCSEWDLISLENKWDAIPYSFVVDWVVNVAGCLDILDSHAQMCAYEIDDVCDSVKREIDLSGHLGRIQSLDVDVKKFTYSSYHRVYPDAMKLPVFTRPLEPIGDGLQLWKHIVDIGMLVIQRI